MLRTLYLDMNSYFASVEQQSRPELRGRPIVTAPVTAPSGCCVAVSIEAKRFGVRTGMRLREAERLCPELIAVKTRPTLYIETHHKVLEAITTVIPVEEAHSIDEVSCALMSNERSRERAVEIAQAAKDAIRARVGECLRSSVGVAPNPLLAKVASNMRKPDGLTVIEQHELPGPLLDLVPRDLPNIGPKMEARLERAGVRTVAQLYDQREVDLERIWGGVVGRQWYHLLRGEPIARTPTRRRSLGHEHVLPPDERDDASALATLLRLTHKAAARLRHEGYLADRIGIGARPNVPRRSESEVESGERIGRWRLEHRFAMPHADTHEFLAAARGLWARKPAGQCSLVSVTLGGLTTTANAEPSLFDQPRTRDTLWRAVDQINARFGGNAVFAGAIHGMHEQRLGGIAFRSVPSLDLPDTL